MKPVEVVRLFSGSDSSMTGTARVIHELFRQDLAFFTAFDVSLNTEFAEAFLAIIEAAEIVVADSAIIDQQVSLTEHAYDAMDQARVKYNEVKYFVVKAYPNSAGTQGEFGLNNYSKARRSRNQMAQFLNEMHLACVKYQEGLVAAGYNAEAIAAILPLRNELIQKNTSQKIFRKQRPKLTEDRIKVLNSCYRYLVQVLAAGQLVFPTDYAKQKQYVYRPSGRKKETEDYSDTLSPGSSVTIATVAYTPESLLVFYNTGMGTMSFCLAMEGTMEGNWVTLPSGAEITKTMAQLQEGGTQLMVRNDDLDREGSYALEIHF